MAFLWILLAIVYAACWIYVGLATFRRGAAMTGDSKRFTRQDGVEQCWRVMQPLLQNPPPVHSHAKGSWGPKPAEKVISGYERWHQPWVVK